MGFLDSLKKELKSFDLTKEDNKNSNLTSDLKRTEKIDEVFAITLKNCKRMKTDLVECPKHNSTCSICQTYQDRIYSVSGKDKRFPKLPECVYQYGGFHQACRHSFYPFVYGVSALSSGRKDVIKWSNRPFK